MTVYTPNDNFPNSEIYDLSDLVKGGASGASNTPLKALADQTLYLLNRLMRYEDVKILTGDYSYDAVNDIRKMLTFNISTNSTLSLPDAGALKVGTIISISVKTTGIKALTVACYGTQVIEDGNNSVSAMYMHDAERLKLVVASSSMGTTGDFWKVELAQGNFYNVGQTVYAYAHLRNTGILQGQLVNRQDMPRLSAFGLALSNTVNDTLWLSHPVNYRGLFSTGNGVSTFRFPDERGMFTRALDLGRGVDTSRVGNYPGGFELDNTKQLDTDGTGDSTYTILTGHGYVAQDPGAGFQFRKKVINAETTPKKHFKTSFNYILV